MSVRSKLLSQYNTLSTTIHKISNTLVVSHLNVFRTTISDDVWIRRTISDNEDPTIGHVIR